MEQKLAMANTPFTMTIKETKNGVVKDVNGKTINPDRTIIYGKDYTLLDENFIFHHAKSEFIVFLQKIPIAI